MSTESITPKIVSLVVVVLMLTVVALPLITDANTETESITTTHTFGNNSLDTYTETVAQSSIGDISPTYTALRGDYDTGTNAFTEDTSSGEWIKAYDKAVSSLTFYVNASSTVYTTTGVAAVLSQQTLPYVLVDGDTSWTFTVDAENNQIATVSVDTTTGTSFLVMPYDVTYVAPAQLTYGTNSIHSLILTDVVGDMNGTTFTPNAGGDWLQIPLHVMQNSTETYKVLNGATIYAPDTNGDLAAFTASAAGTISGTHSDVQLSLATDTSVANATVYILTATITNTDLPALVIPHEVVTYTVVPPSDVAKIIIGGNTSFYITTDGTLYGTGTNANGQLGNGSTSNVTTWTQLATSVADIVSDGNTSFYITTDGTLYGTGPNDNGQLGNGSRTGVTTWTQLATGVADVVVSGGRSFYITTDGTLYGTGWNYNGQLGNGGSSVTTWTQLATGVADVVVSGSTSFYISTDGTLYGTGYNNNGQLGNGSTSNVTTWTQLATGVADVVASDSTSFYITTDGTLYGTGTNTNGQIGNGSRTGVTTWTQLATGVADVVTGSWTSFYISTDGTLYGTGFNWYSQIGDDSANDVNTWTQLATGVADVLTSGYASFYISTDGTLYGTGTNNNGQLGGGGFRKWTQLATSVADVVGNGRTSFYITTDGDLYSTGTNSNGQAGWGGETESSTSFIPASAPQANTIYTNPTETETVSDQRGTVTNNVFTASADGDYLYVPMLDAVEYTYYVSVGSTVYAPNQAGTALAPHVVPDTTGIDPEVTITLTQVNGYNDQIYSVTATTTNTDIVGWAIPYTVTYTGTQDTHYAYNWYGDSETYLFTADANGEYLKIPASVLDGNTYYVDNEAIYGVGTDSSIAVHECPDTSGVSGLVLSFTASETYTDVYELTGSGTSYLYIPLTYDGTRENDVDSYTITYTPVRATYENGAFTADEDGDYVLLYGPLLDNYTYYIGAGRTYYVVSNLMSAEATLTAPNEPDAAFGLAIGFAAHTDIPQLYDISADGSNPSDTSIAIPYTATYDTTHEETVEKYALVGTIAVVMVIAVIVFIFRNIIGRDD